MRGPFYPVNMKLAGRRCAVVGGGHIALRRAEGLVAAEAKVTVIAPRVVPEISDLARQGNVRWIPEAFTASHIVGMFLVVCATDNETVNRSVAWASKAAGALVNMAAPPMELGDFTVPSKVESRQLLLTASTSGASPGMARILRQEMEEKILSVYDPWLERLAPLREKVRQVMADSRAREDFWHTVLNDDLMALVREGKYDEAEAQVKDAISRFGAQS